MRNERINLPSYGSKEPENDCFDIVKISLGRNNKHKPINIEALLVESINDIIMAGVSNFAIKLSNKGFKLADDRLTSICDDSVKVVTLIGADFYVKFVSPYLAKKQLYGMWVDFITWGKSSYQEEFQG